MEEKAPKRIKHIFLLSLYSMLRPGEVAKLRWDWIENNTLTIPAEEMKMRRVHRVPLTAFATDLLREIKSDTKHKRSVFIFPGQKSCNHVNSQTLTNYMRSQDFFKDRLVPHGLRSIASLGWRIKAFLMKQRNLVLHTLSETPCLEPIKEAIFRSEKGSYGAMEFVYQSLCSKFPRKR